VDRWDRYNTVNVYSGSAFDLVVQLGCCEVI